VPSLVGVDNLPSAKGPSANDNYTPPSEAAAQWPASEALVEDSKALLLTALATHATELRVVAIKQFGKDRGEDIAQEAALRILEKRKWPNELETADSALRYLRGTLWKTGHERRRKRDCLEVYQLPTCCVSELASPEDETATWELLEELNAKYPEELAFVLEYTPHEGTENIPQGIRHIVRRFRNMLSPVVKRLGFQDTRRKRPIPANDNGKKPRKKQRR
jgi:DNA-directed RNA polymerase specialized sigma24 family protein